MKMADNKNNKNQKQQKMKTRKRIDNAWMMAAAAFGFAVMTHSASAATTILISPGTGAADDIKNGGFESSTGTTYAQIAPWFNFAGNTSTAASTDANFKRTGTLGASVSTSVSLGKQVPALTRGTRLRLVIHLT
jgi:hypothetical protein